METLSRDQRFGKVRINRIDGHRLQQIFAVCRRSSNENRVIVEYLNGKPRVAIEDARTARGSGDNWIANPSVYVDCIVNFVSDTAIHAIVVEKFRQDLRCSFRMHDDYNLLQGSNRQSARTAVDF